MNIPLIPADKAQHYFYGSAAGLLGGVVALLAHRLVGLPVHAVPVAVLGMAAAAGIAKEWLDARANRQAAQLGEAPPHEVSGADVCWTIAGASTAAIVSIALLLALHIPKGA